MSGDLLALRRNAAASGDSDRDKLHATTDEQALRDEVFKVLARHEFRIDATLLEKSKAQPQTRTSEAMFYQYAWYYHFRKVGPSIARRADKLMITAAALGHKKTRAAFKNAVNNTVQQVIERKRWEVSFLESSQDPMLWAADYCAWAVQRKWEMEDARSYALIETRISTEYDLWRTGVTHYY